MFYDGSLLVRIIRLLLDHIEASYFSVHTMDLFLIQYQRQGPGSLLPYHVLIFTLLYRHPSAEQYTWRYWPPIIIYFLHRSVWCLS